MGVYIKGMEMPKEFDPDVYIELACGIDGDRYARLYNFHQGGITEWCEVIHVPPHGKLIEESKVLDIVSEWCPDDDGTVGKDGDLREMLDEIEALPTIIEAEEGET